MLPSASRLGKKHDAVTRVEAGTSSDARSDARSTAEGGSSSSSAGMVDGGHDAGVPDAGSDAGPAAGILVGGTGPYPGPISGVHYRSTTQSGYTSAAGGFTYLPGETVTFSIADVDFAPTPGVLRTSRPGSSRRRRRVHRAPS